MVSLSTFILWADKDCRRCPYRLWLPAACKLSVYVSKIYNLTQGTYHIPVPLILNKQSCLFCGENDGEHGIKLGPLSPSKGSTVYVHSHLWASLMDQWVKISPAVQEAQKTRVQSLAWEDPLQFISVQLLSCVLLFVTPWTAAPEASLSILLELSQTHVHQVSDVIQSSHPLSSPSLPAFSLSRHQGLFPIRQLFASGGQSIGASTSASILPMNTQD